MNPRYCRTCGKQVMENAVACMGCGVPPKNGKEHCFHCGASMRPEAVICVACGVSVSMGKNKGGGIFYTETGEKTSFNKITDYIFYVFLLLMAGFALYRFLEGKNEDQAESVALLRNIAILVCIFIVGAILDKSFGYKRCPQCGSRIRKMAKVCKHCEFTFP